MVYTRTTLTKVSVVRYFIIFLVCGRIECANFTRNKKLILNENISEDRIKFSFAVKVLNFNRLQPAPDAMSCGGNLGTGSVGLTQRGADVAELLEKQVKYT